MGTKITLSARMEAVARMVTPGNRVCDVGCDHGYVSLYLVQQEIAPCVIAMDVGTGPLDRAREHVQEAGMQQYINLRLSDGLSAYRPGEADSLILAGMGGKLMRRILEREREKTDSFKELILQPQSQIREFRAFLREAGYFITDENMILEDEKFYPVIRAVLEKQPSRHQEKIELLLEDSFGPRLLSEKHPVLQLFLKREWEKADVLKRQLVGAKASHRAGRRIEELTKEMELISQAAGLMGMEELYDNDNH